MIYPLFSISPSLFHFTHMWKREGENIFIKNSRIMIKPSNPTSFANKRKETKQLDNSDIKTQYSEKVAVFAYLFSLYSLIPALHVRLLYTSRFQLWLLTSSTSIHFCISMIYFITNARYLS